jgi:hypothetical protein
MKARVHLRNGLISVIVDAITTVPAINTVGAAIVSSRLSSHGI